MITEKFKEDNKRAFRIICYFVIIVIKITKYINVHSNILFTEELIHKWVL